MFKILDTSTAYNEHIFTARKRSLGQCNIFAPVCHSVHRRGTWAGTTSGRYTPGQVHPHLAGTPPRQVTPLAGAPPEQVHPLGRYTQPSNACWDMVNKQAVRILLECILVMKPYKVCTIKEFTRTFSQSEHLDFLRQSSFSVFTQSWQCWMSAHFYVSI